MFISINAWQCFTPVHISHYLRVTVGKMLNQCLSAVWLCKSQNWWICKTSPCGRTEWISNTSVKCQTQEINVLASTSSKPEKCPKSYSSYSLKRQMKASEQSSIVVNISVIIEYDSILFWLRFFHSDMEQPLLTIQTISDGYDKGKVPNIFLTEYHSYMFTLIFWKLC